VQPAFSGFVKRVSNIRGVSIDKARDLGGRLGLLAHNPNVAGSNPAPAIAAQRFGIPAAGDVLGEPREISIERHDVSLMLKRWRG
jgi:hypothetical protein